MPLFSKQLVDLVVQISNLELAQASVLNLRNFLRDLSDDLQQIIKKLARDNFKLKDVCYL